MSIGVSVINRKINLSLCDTEFCKVLQRRCRYKVCHFTYHKDISTVFAEKPVSGVEGEESHKRYVSTFFSELRMISVMALTQFYSVCYTLLSVDPYRNLPKIFCLKLMALYACNNGLLSINCFTIHLNKEKKKRKKEVKV